MEKISTRDGLGLDDSTYLLYARAFRDAAGMDMESLVKSAPFARIVEAMAEPVDECLSDVEYLKNVHTASYSLNTQSSIELDDTLILEDDNNPYELALIFLLGKGAIAAAKKRLPWRSIELADAYGSTQNEYEKYEVLSEVFRILESDDWEEANPGRVTARDDDSGLPVRDYSSAMPNMQNDFPYTEAMTSCLGISVYLAAWAEQAGVQHLHNATITHGTSHAGEITASLLYQVAETLASEGITYSSKTYDYFDHWQKAAEKLRDRIDDAHHSALYRVTSKDKDIWLQMDPYQGKFVLFEAAGDQSPVIQGLIVMANFHPGLVLPFSNKEYYDADDQIMEEVLEYEEQITTLFIKFFKDDIPSDNRRLYKKCVKFCLEVMPQVDVSSAHIDHTMPYNSPNYWYRLAFYNMITEEVSSGLKIHNESRTVDLSSDYVERYNTDESYRARVIDNMAARPLFNCSNMISDYLQNQCNASNLGCYSSEVSIPSFSIGLYVLNHLLSTSKYDNVGLSGRLSSYSGSQILWRNAHLVGAPTSPASARMDKIMAQQPDHLVENLTRLLVESNRLELHEQEAERE